MFWSFLANWSGQSLVRRIVHPATDEEGRYKSPLKVGVRNSIAGLVPVAAVGLFYALKFHALSPHFAWWVFFIVAFAIPIVSFAHAFLGSIIGGHKATNIFGVIFLLVLTIGIYLLTQYAESL